MDYHQLLYFQTVAAYENISKAAEVLHISQPTLSKYIARLEEEIGQPLFNRKGKRISLNAAGSQFLSYSTDSIKFIDAGIRKVHESNNLENPKVSICLVSDCQRIYSCIHDFYKSHLGFQFDIEKHLSSTQTPDINDYDIIICPDTPKYQQLSGSFFFLSSSYLAVPSGHSLENKKEISMQDLNGLDIVYIKQDDATESSIWGMRVLSVKPNRGHFVNSRDAQRELISMGMGCGIVTKEALPLFKEEKTIKLIPIADERFNVKTKICFKRERHLGKGALQFRDYIKDYFNINCE